MAIGTVKWFNNAKGYGFICPQGDGEDIFAHFSAISMEGYKSLKAGQTVYFQVSKGPKGLHATEITPVDGETPVTTSAATTEPSTNKATIKAKELEFAD